MDENTVTNFVKLCKGKAFNVTFYNKKEQKNKNKIQNAWNNLLGKSF